MKSYTFGIDVGGTTVKMGLFNEKNLICKWSVPTDKEDSGTKILPKIHREISEKMREFGIKPKEVRAGMGVPGPVLEDGSIGGCWNLGWGCFQLKEEAEMLFGIPVEVCNDADAAVLGETWHGAARGYKNIFMLTLGTGTGGGLLLDGKIVRGVHGCGGEWGHIQVNPEESEACVCGRKGCINQYASVSGMMHMAERIIDRQEQGMKDGLYGRITKPEDIWRLAREGNEIGMQVIDSFSGIIGKAMVSVSCLVDPEVFIIGGGLSAAGDLLLKKIRDSYRKSAYAPCVDTPILLASLGNDAGIWGSAGLQW